MPGRENSIELATHDDWSRYGIACKRDIADLFVPNFYFACEPHAPNERGDTAAQPGDGEAGSVNRHRASLLYYLADCDRGADRNRYGVALDRVVTLRSLIGTPQRTPGRWPRSRAG